VKKFLIHILFLAFSVSVLAQENPVSANNGVTETPAMPATNLPPSPATPQAIDAPTPNTTANNEQPKEENTDKTPEEKPYQPYDGEDISKLNAGFETILFKDSNLEPLYNALSRRKNVIAKNRENIQQTTQQEAEEEQKEEDLSDKNIQAPSFYLTTILYPKDKNWTIWLNGNKVRKEIKLQPPEPEIIKVRASKVTFIWKSDMLDKLSPKFRNILRKVTENDDVSREADSGWDYISNDGKIVFDSIRKKVKFTIGINQTFSVYNAKIFEGFVPPTNLILRHKENGSIEVVRADVLLEKDPNKRTPDPEYKPN
jgi:hypothetical protein